MRNKKLIVLLSVVLVFVLLVVTCGATFLVRNIDAYSYYEIADGTDYDSEVLKAAGIKKNSSIFFVDEAEVKARVEKAYANIGVVNVKRSFPDKVTINYVVYERSFQFENGGKYYQCYSSGRIGSTSSTRTDGYFTVKPASATNTRIGEYFQNSAGTDRKAVDAFIAFMHDKGLSDFMITQFTEFIDLTRDGYVYIRTKAGCSIEIHGSQSDFKRLMDRAFAIYKDGRTEQATGLIRAEINRSETSSDPIRSTYIRPGAGIDYTDDGYYALHYSAHTVAAP